MTVFETCKSCNRNVSVGETITDFKVRASTFQQYGIDVESFFLDIFSNVRNPGGNHQWRLVCRIRTDIVVGTVKLTAVQQLEVAGPVIVPTIRQIGFLEVVEVDEIVLFPMGIGTIARSQTE